MKFYVAVVQDREADTLGGYIVTGTGIEHVRPLAEAHQGEFANIVILDGSLPQAHYVPHHFFDGAEQPRPKIEPDAVEAAIERINNRQQMRDLADRLGVRRDWHEPDEQEVDAFVVGGHRALDNAMGADPFGRHEPNVVITKGGVPVAVVNLATLLAFGCGTYEGR